jgi:hypothetical protein
MYKNYDQKMYMNQNSFFNTLKIFKFMIILIILTPSCYFTLSQKSNISSYNS